MAKVNSWLLVNLGCEMLYIIDQRLIAQNIEKEKSSKVMRDVTNALLSPTFFTYISTTFSDEIMSLAQARILLTDIACCSLMRLDVHSLDKLFDLMVMIFKWQMFLMNSPDDLLSITLRHLQGISRIMPDKAKMILIDQANQNFFTSWREYNEEYKYSAVRKINRFLAPHNIRISLLIRMKLQLRDGSFVDKSNPNDFLNYYVHNVGENIYEKVNHFPQYQNAGNNDEKQASQEIDFLFQQFKVDLSDEVIDDKMELKTNSKDEKQDDTIPTDQKKTLDELKKKCKLDVTPQHNDLQADDNFQELLNMLGNNGS
ncbi:hypothetical protein ACKWTF_013113 [Chironomus riparius]